MGKSFNLFSITLTFIFFLFIGTIVFSQNYIGFGNFDTMITLGIAHREDTYTLYGGFSYGFSGLLGVGIQGGYRATNLLEVQIGELGKWRMGVGAGANGTAMFSIFSPIPFYLSAGAGVAFFHDWDLQQISFHSIWIGGIGVSTSPWLFGGFVQPSISTFFGISF